MNSFLFTNIYLYVASRFCRAVLWLLDVFCLPVRVLLWYEYISIYPKEDPMLCGGMLSVCHYHDFLKRLFKQKNVTIDKNLATGALYLFLNQTDFNEHTYHTHTKAIFYPISQTDSPPKINCSLHHTQTYRPPTRRYNSSFFIFSSLLTLICCWGWLNTTEASYNLSTYVCQFRPTQILIQDCFN